MLKPGDTVGIVSPASPAFEEGDLEISKEWLFKLGLKWKLGKHIFDKWSDFAGSDEDRLRDFEDMWADPSIAAVWPLRGGNGSIRLLANLDWNLISAHPKALIGFSDNTGLLISIFQKTGLVTFHGPSIASFFQNAYTYSYFQKALMQVDPIGEIIDPPPSEWGSHYPPRLVIANGSAKGQLVGGCLTPIRELMGTPYEIDTKDKIVFLEDVTEEPFSIDRMLTQLLLAGKLKDAKGIVLGEFVNCLPGESKRKVLAQSHSVEHVIRERLSGLGIPVIFGLKFGHTKDKFSLPLGVIASLNATAEGAQFFIEESGVC